MPRLDTRLETEAAEFLVLGQLLLERIAAYKTYTNMPGYDLVATNPEKNLAAKIQVKSRWRTGAPGFPIKSFDSDFVVFCRLNRGDKAGTAKIRPPDYFVFPIALIRAAPRSPGWGKIAIRSIVDFENYRDRWDLVRAFLQLPAPRATAAPSSPVVPAVVPRLAKAEPVLSPTMVAHEDRSKRPSDLETRESADAIYTRPLTLPQLRSAMVALDGRELQTMYRTSTFLFRILPAEHGVEYTPVSTGKARRHTWRRIAMVLERFNVLGSMHPGDYHDLSKNASYLLTLIRLVMRERHSSGGN